MTGTECCPGRRHNETMVLGTRTCSRRQRRDSRRPTRTRPIRVVVPFSAGSGTDIVARTMMEGCPPGGQPIIVENRFGAGGTIGIGSVAKADPDGYTLLIQSTSFAVVASTYSKPG